MRYLIISAGFILLIWLWSAALGFFARREAKDKKENEQTVKMVDAMHLAVCANPKLLQRICESQAITSDVLNLLFEVKRRYLRGTADQMFSVRVENFGGFGTDSFEGERYDYRTGKTHRVRKNRALKLALSDEAKGFFRVHSRKFRGGVVLNGLSPSERGNEVLLSIVQTFKQPNEPVYGKVPRTPID